MGFMSKIKNMLGMVGVDLELKVPTEVTGTTGTITGSVAVTSKTDQNMLTLDVEFEEEWKTGRGADAEVQTLTLGETQVVLNKPIKAGESIEIPFEFVYQIEKSTTQAWAEKGGALGALGKLGGAMSGEKSTYQISACLDLKGVALDPSTDVKVIVA